MIHHQINRHEWLDDFRISTEALHCATHRSEINHQRHAGEILQNDARDDEWDFLIRRRFRVPVGQRFDIFAPDFLAIAISQHRFQHNADAHRQPRNFSDALSFQCRQRIEEAFAPLPASNFLSALNSSLIPWLSYRAKSTYLSLPSPKISRDSSTPRGMTKVHFNSSSLALILSKLGSCLASSLLSAYWITPFLSMMNADRFGTPAIPRFICGRKESYITP